MKDFIEYLEEGVNDPAIFRAVFLAGGPGSGKSFVVGKTALQPLGLKLINSDPSFEAALKKAGLTTSPEDIASAQGQAARVTAKRLTGKKMTDRRHFTHSGYPGGQRETSPEQMFNKRPTSLVEHAVRGMLPKSRLGRVMFRNLFVYAGTEHPHEAQKPKEVNFNIK